jgi:hypothetical protein
MPGHARFQLRGIGAVIFGVQKSHFFPKGALTIEYDYRRRFARELLWKFFRNKRGNCNFFARLLVATAEFDFYLWP